MLNSTMPLYQSVNYRNRNQHIEKQEMLVGEGNGGLISAGFGGRARPWQTGRCGRSSRTCAGHMGLRRGMFVDHHGKNSLQMGRFSPTLSWWLC